MAERHELAKKTLIYRLPGVDEVVVRTGETYRATEAGPLTIDLFYPPDYPPGPPSARRLPAVVFVLGHSDVGVVPMLGCRLHEMEAVKAWARLIAASGMVCVTYANEEPVADLSAVLAHIRLRAEGLNIDEHRIGLFATAGHVPLALWTLMQGHDWLKCAALFYGYTLDLDGSTVVADSGRTWRFVTPAAGRSVDDLPRHTPLFVARAGRDETPGLNDALDRFVSHALSRNLPLTLVNHATGPHVFEMFDDTEATREVIRQGLAFLRFHLAMPCASTRTAV